MQFVIVLVLALATSLDSLGMGVAFGLNGTRIRFRAHAIISAVMLLITAGSVVAGDRITLVLKEADKNWQRDTCWVSAFLFVVVGIGMLVPLFRALRAGKFCYTADEASDCCPVREAEAAGEVRMRDAVGLGFILSVNNIGAGVSVGMNHVSPLLMAVLTVVFNVLCICGGHQAGSLLRRTPVRSWAQLIAAATMLAIGIYEFCQPTTI